MVNSSSIRSSTVSSRKASSCLKAGVAAGKMGFLDLPDELILTVLGNLGKQSLKRMRLVCQRLASIGATLLLDAIYISPHAKNMEVFEAITQHPVFSASVKNIVFDSAFFAIDSPNDYGHALCRQFRDPVYRRIKIYDGAVRQLIKTFRYRYGTQSHSLVRCGDHAELIEGYRQYRQLAHAQKTYAWFSCVCEGLRKLGAIRSVTIRHSWSMIHDDIIADDNDEWSTNGDDCGIDQYDFENEANSLDHWYPTWQVCGSSNAAWIDRFPKRSPGMEYNGRRLVGSPLARSWPPSMLNPTISSVGKAFDFLCELLMLTGKRPLELRVLGKDEAEGLPPCSLDSDDSFFALCFLGLSSKLDTLDIVLTAAHKKTYPYLMERFPELPLLKAFFKTARWLTTLCLTLPVDKGHNDHGYSLYKFTDVFPSLGMLQMPSLHTLELRGLETSYHDLAGLLFLKLPRLRCLELTRIQMIKGGNWEDIIEGLRYHRSLITCSLRVLAYPNFQTYSSQLAASSEAFLDENSQYIVLGGRHPALKEEEVDRASSNYLERLNATLDSLREAIGTSVV